MHLAIDLDRTITAAPKLFAKLLAALHEAGEEVTVLTGGDPDKDGEAKEQLLTEAGCAGLYDKLKIVAKDGPGLPENKAVWCKKHDVDVFIDNDLANCGTVLASGHVPLVLVALTNDTNDLRARQTMDLLRARLAL